MTPAATSNTEVAPDSILVSTGNSDESTDPVYAGIAFKVSCFDSHHKTVCINNREASFQITLFDAENKPVNKVKYDDLIINYLPTGVRDNVLWVPFEDFMPFYDGALMTYPYRKFEGSVKLVLTLPGHNPLEATIKISLYLNGSMAVSQKEYADYVASHGPPPIQPTPSIIVGNYHYFPDNGDENVATSPTFVWEPELMALGATSYNFRIYSDPEGKKLIDSKTGLPNIYKLSVPLEHGQTYYWQTQGVIRGLPHWDWNPYGFKTGH